MTKVIAEIGTNHEGNLDLACEMIEKFAKAGANIIKFQSFIVDDMIPKTAPYYKRMKKLELKKEWYEILFQTCKKNNVEFLSTATSFKSIEWMEKIGVSMYKVASGNATHMPIIDKLIEINKPIIISVGLLELNEIFELVKYFEMKNFEKFSLLHCQVEYPTPIQRANLENIAVLKEIFKNISVGYSDHTTSILTPSIAVSLGAEIIEKHVYLRKGDIGMDYDVAISLNEFEKMVKMIRETELMLKMDFSISEEFRFLYRRSFHAKRDIKKGEVFSFENLKISRPEDGIKPKYYKELIGKKANKNIKAESAVKWEDVL
jgi:N,N'-diacetyllegionaminate synthase